MSEWVKMMDQDSAGNYMKFPENQPVIVHVLSDPERTIAKIQGKDVTQYNIKAKQEGSDEEKIWSVTARGLMQQLVSLANTNKLETLVDHTLQVIATGSGKERRWFVTLIK